MSDITIDLHGFTVEMAKREVEQAIARAGSNVKTVTVIHGYHRGDKIRSMIQSPNGIRSKRIKKKRFTMNQGETIFELF